MIPGKRIGIYGGSFDPPHLGHLHLGKTCCKQFNLDGILYLCARENPFKPQRGNTWKHRLSMLALMLRDEEKLSISLADLLHPEPSYTYKSLEAIHSWYGLDEKPYYFMGDDVAREFTQWKRYRRILQLARLVVVDRTHKVDAFPFHCERIDIEALPFSSSMLRKTIAEGGNCSHFLHSSVQNYIIRNNLYIYNEY